MFSCWGRDLWLWSRSLISNGNHLLRSIEDYESRWCKPQILFLPRTSSTFCPDWVHFLKPPVLDRPFNQRCLGVSWRLRSVHSQVWLKRKYIVTDFLKFRAPRSGDDKVAVLWREYMIRWKIKSWQHKATRDGPLYQLNRIVRCLDIDLMLL